MRDKTEIMDQAGKAMADKEGKYLSLDNSQENKERILSCGADRFFTKPLNKKVLISEIRHLIGTE